MSFENLEVRGCFDGHKPTLAHNGILFRMLHFQTQLANINLN